MGLYIWDTEGRIQLPKLRYIVPFVTPEDIQDSCVELDDTGYEEESHPSKAAY